MDNSIKDYDEHNYDIYHYVLQAIALFKSNCRWEYCFNSEMKGWTTA